MRPIREREHPDACNANPRSWSNASLCRGQIVTLCAKPKAILTLQASSKIRTDFGANQNCTIESFYKVPASSLFCEHQNDLPSVSLSHQQQHELTITFRTVPTMESADINTPQICDGHRGRVVNQSKK